MYSEDLEPACVSKLGEYYVGYYEGCCAHRPLSSSFCSLYLESYKVIPRRSYLGAYGYRAIILFLAARGRRAVQFLPEKGHGQRDTRTR